MYSLIGRCVVECIGYFLATFIVGMLVGLFDENGELTTFDFGAWIGGCIYCVVRVLMLTSG